MELVCGIRSLPANARATTSFKKFKDDINLLMASSYSHRANMPISFTFKICFVTDIFIMYVCMYVNDENS